MKKFLFLLSFLTLGALTTMNAQTAEKACSKKSAKCCAKKATASAEAATTKTVASATATADSKVKACSKTASSKACCAKKGAKTTSVAGVSMTASEAARKNEMIEERTCAKSGATSYYQKAICPMSGKTSYTQVTYDAETAKFVNMAPSDAEAPAKKACSKTKAACTKEVKSAKVVKTSVNE